MSEFGLACIHAPKMDSLRPRIAAAGTPKASFPNSRLVNIVFSSHWCDIGRALATSILGAIDYVTGFNSHPLRYTGFTYLFASRLFVNSIFFGSHNNLPSTRVATAPSTIHSV